MKLFHLLKELNRQGASVTVTEQMTLSIDYKSKLTDELREVVRVHKHRLIEIFLPCRHCGEKLVHKIASTWFQARCPSEPCHFLIEEHEHSLGHTSMSEHLRAISPSLSLTPDDWMKMQSDILDKAEELARDEGISLDDALVRAKAFVVERFLAAAGFSNDGVVTHSVAAIADVEKVKDETMEKRSKRKKAELVLF